MYSQDMKPMFIDKFDIMNHDSGFIIRIAPKNWQNPNRMLTKQILKIILMAFNCAEKRVRVFFIVI